MAGLALIGQGALSIMRSIHGEGAVQLISLDKEKQTLVQCWRAHPIHYPHATPDYLFNAIAVNYICIYSVHIYVNSIITLGLFTETSLPKSFRDSPKNRTAVCYQSECHIVWELGSQAA